MTNVQDIPANREMGVLALLFSVPSFLLLALQRVGGSGPWLALVREHGIWVVVFSNIGFTLAGLSGDPNHPVLASALGVAVGAAIGLVLVFGLGLWRASQARARKISQESAAQEALAAALALAKSHQEVVKELRKLGQSPPRLGLSHFDVQQFLRQKTNRN